MVWPQPGEALDRTIAAEHAIENLYAEAFRRWAPHAQAAALPTLTAGQDTDTLPPDPAAVAHTAYQWSRTAETVIITGIGLLWAAAVIEAMSALGVTLPTIDRHPGAEGDPKVWRIVDRAVGDMNHDQLAAADAAVEHVAELREARTTMLDRQRTALDRTLAAVQNTARRAAADATGADHSAQRSAVADALNPAGQDLRDLARSEGYQAAGILNHAIIEAANQANQEFGEELHKCWIATLDSKTRASHFASDGARVPINANFTVGAAELAYPGDPTGPPEEVANCRCRLGILTADEDLPDEVDRHTERLDGRDSVVVNRDQRTQAEEIERRRAAGNVRARDTEDGTGRVASAAPSEETDMTVTTEQAAAAEDTTAAADGEETFYTFTDALFAVTGVPTSDGRMLAADIELTFRDTPLPLQWCEESEGGHYGSVTVGVIEALRFTDGEVRGDGYMLNNTNAAKAIDLVAHGVCNPSVDLGDAEAVWTDTDGVPVTDDTYVEGMDLLMTVTKGEVLATTIVAIPAFGQTRIRINEQRETRDKALVAGLVASLAAAHTPPVYDPALFADPKLSAPTRITITEDGHVFGHIATWKDKHRSVGLGHIKPPRSHTGYEHFHSSPGVHLSDGTVLPVGRLTVGIGHAPTRGVSAAAAAAHYDNVDACWALGRIGEDRHGIYFSGVVAPWASPEKVQMGLASPLSGDWRPIGGNLELVAVLSVNTPGFLCKVETDSTGQPLAMVASLAPTPRAASGGVEHLSIEQIKAAMVEVLAETQRAAELAARRDAAAARAQQAVGEPPAPPTVGEQIHRLLQRA